MTWADWIDSDYNVGVLSYGNVCKYGTYQWTYNNREYIYRDNYANLSGDIINYKNIAVYNDSNHYSSVAPLPTDKITSKVYYEGTAPWE